MNEYGIVLIEILIAIISGFISIRKINQNNETFTWKQFGYRIILFFVLLVITIIYLIEYRLNESVFTLFGMFIGVLLVSILLCLFFILLFNFIFTFFKEKKYSFFHFILNFKDILSYTSLNRLSQINNLTDASFIFVSLFALGSMIVAFILHFFIIEKTTIYLLEKGPLLILIFVVLAIALWIFSLFIHLVYYERIKEEDIDINRIQLKKKVLEKNNEW